MDFDCAFPVIFLHFPATPATKSVEPDCSIYPYYFDGFSFVPASSVSGTPESCGARIAAQIEVLSLRPARNAARMDLVSSGSARIAAQIEVLSLRPASNAARLTVFETCEDGIDG
ncbi:unnamed protein product [Prunus armeniaca]